MWQKTVQQWAHTVCDTANSGLLTGNPNNMIFYHEAMDMDLSNQPEKWEICLIIVHKVKCIL